MARKHWRAFAGAPESHKDPYGLAGSTLINKLLEERIAEIDPGYQKKLT